MPDLSAMTGEQLARMAQQHLEALRAAGVQWLPFAPLPASLPVAAVSAGVESSTAPAAPASPELFTPAADTKPVSSVEERAIALQVLAQRVAACARCPELVSTRTQTVFGVGPPGAELCLIGEAPGADEDAQGEPFVGPAGQLLNRILAACRLSRDEVYICNILRCRPPGNRTPLPNECANCREYLEQQLDLVQPRFICALGGCAAQKLLGTTASIGRLRGRFHDYRGIPVMVTYHPSYLLPHRNPAMKGEVWKDMKMLMARMGRPV